MTPTPRTDAQFNNRGALAITTTVSTDFARELERELNEAKSDLAEAERMREFFEKGMDETAQELNELKARNAK